MEVGENKKRGRKAKTERREAVNEHLSTEGGERDRE
jgi:hypothetical protein